MSEQAERIDYLEREITTLQRAMVRQQAILRAVIEHEVFYDEDNRIIYTPGDAVRNERVDVVRNEPMTFEMLRRMLESKQRKEQEEVRVMWEQLDRLEGKKDSISDMDSSGVSPGGELQ